VKRQMKRQMKRQIKRQPPQAVWLAAGGRERK
jgi:hypothetical protein